MKLIKKYFTYHKESGDLTPALYDNLADIVITVVRDQVVDTRTVGEYSIEREWYNLKYLTPRDE